MMTERGLMEPHQPHSPKLVQGIPMRRGRGVWIQTAVLNLLNLGKEWDKAECGDWSCAVPLLPLGEEGPTWAEATC